VVVITASGDREVAGNRASISDSALMATTPTALPPRLSIRATNRDFVRVPSVGLFQIFRVQILAVRLGFPILHHYAAADEVDPLG
jgi:hypothetical protein